MLKMLKNFQVTQLPRYGVKILLNYRFSSYKITSDIAFLISYMYDEQLEKYLGEIIEVQKFEYEIS